MNKSLLIHFGGFFLLSFIVAYLVPDIRGTWLWLDVYSHFAGMLVPMIRKIEVLSIRLHMAPSYYFSLMWVAAFVLYFLLLRLPHDYFVSPEKARGRRVYVTLMCLIVIPLLIAYTYFLPLATPDRLVRQMTLSRSGLAIAGGIDLSAAVVFIRIWWAWFSQRKLIYQKHSNDLDKV